MPTAREEAAELGDRPTPPMVRMAFYLFVAAGVLWVFGGVMDRLNRDAIVRQLVEFRRERGEEVTVQQTTDLVTQAIWTWLVLGVIFAVFLALFGYKATHGVRKARTLVTVLASITALFHIFFNSSFIVGVTIALAALAGIILLYLPSSRAHFQPHRR